MIWELLTKLLFLFVGFTLFATINKYLIKSQFIFNNIDYLFYFILLFIIFSTISGNKNNIINNNNQSIKLEKIETEEFKLTSEQKEKFKLLPKTLSMLNNVENKEFNIIEFQFKTENKKYYDEVKFLNNGLVEIFNDSGFIDLKKYRAKENEIKHYLGVKKEDSIKITEHGNNSIIIDIFDRFPKNAVFDESYLRSGEIFMGFNEKGEKIFVPIKNLSHFLISGSAGAGKSVLETQMINGLVHNLNKKDEKGKDYIKKIYFIDLKQVSFNRYRRVSEKIKVAIELEEVYPIIEEIYKLNKETQKEILKTQLTDNEEDKKEDEAIFLIIDENAELMDSKPPASNKEEYAKFEKMIKEIYSIIQTGRSQNIKVMIATQKATVDSVPARMRTNLQSRILMKSKDTESIVACLGSEDPIEEIGCNPKTFNYGRMIYLQDSPQGVKNLYLQSIYVDSNYYKHVMKINNMKFLDYKNEKDFDESYLEEDFKEQINISNEIEIIEEKTTLGDLIDFRANLWKLTEIINNEDNRKKIRSKLTTINRKLKNDNVDILLVHNELREVEKQIINS